MTIIVFIIVGLIAGFVARAVVPGDDSMGVIPTIALGMVGSFVGGFLGALLFGSEDGRLDISASGIIGSILGAIIALVIFNAVTDRKNTLA